MPKNNMIRIKPEEESFIDFLLMIVGGLLGLMLLCVPGLLVAYFWFA